ncbi:MAG: transcription activator effector binding protein [Spirosoma sp.]|nr:transcription activator effector binding protein [Spirosoma sp.]
MPIRKQITNSLTTDLFSLQVYDESADASRITLETTFVKWAAVEVADFNAVPEAMETYTLSGGLYAVFLHKGAASTGAETFRSIFGTWLPASDYVLDHRAHFELLGKKYKNDDPASEEEIWVPIKFKADCQPRA